MLKAALLAFVALPGMFPLAASALDSRASWREVHVSPAPEGRDDGDGSAEHPFATLERARDEVRAMRKAGIGGGMPDGGVTVTLHAGSYELARTLTLTAEDAGTEAAPIIYRAAPGEDVRISGGRRVTGWAAVTDPAVVARLDPAARGHVLRADLRALGITDFGTIGGGFGLDGGPGLELFFRDAPQSIARYPNEGFITIADVLGKTPVERPNAKACAEGDFTYDATDPEVRDRLARWKDETDPWALGYWLHDWAEQRQRIASIDPAAHRITLQPPYHHYGYRKGGWFYGFNLLCEIDRPGEWFLDRATGTVYFWPPEPIKDGDAVVSTLDTLLSLDGAAHVTFRGLTLEAARGTAIRVDKALGNRVEGCTLRNIGAWAVSMSGADSGVFNCEVTGTGDGGIRLSGGDRATLRPAHLVAENNHIHHWSRWNRMNRQGIALSGAGNRAAHNLLHDSPHTAIVFNGNDHLIEFNEIHDVCKESNDAGAIYAGRDWSMRGNIIRHNYLHHLSGFTGGRDKGCIGIYLDDMFSGVTITGNVFFDVTMAAYIGGGMDNRVENNLFIDCKPAVHVDARGLGWAHKWPEQWLKEIKDKGTLSGVRFDKPPYSERYPDLATLLTRTPPPPAPTGNIIARNIQFGGTWSHFEHDAGSMVTIEHNLLGVDPLFVDPTAARAGASVRAFQLRDDSPAFKAGVIGEAGFPRIPVEKIGRITRSAEEAK
ncbi:MAG: right-handed parallel beta-helix repeat-containing protein [Phycisphaerales bacterium]